MSYFDTAYICTICAMDERIAPGYEAAVLAEHAACLGGNYNFPGVGLSAEDAQFLAARRATRGAT